MTVCVIGGSGFLGRRILNAMAREGLDAVSLDVVPLPPVAGQASNIRFHRTDVTNFEDVVAALSAHRPNIVFNLSFMRENLPRPAMKLNVLGMDNCLEAARICGVGRVVYASSIAVNGGQSNYGDRAIRETDPPAPRKQYDVHKVFNEWQAKEYSEKHGMSIIGVRAANVSGVDKTIGSVDHVDCIVEPAKGRPVLLDYRDRMRCVIHGDDMAEVFKKIALAPSPKHAIYYSGGEALSLGQISDMVRKFVPEAKIAFAHESGGLERSGAYLFNNDRVVEEFGVRYVPYEERIGRMIDDVRRNVAFG